MDCSPQAPLSMGFPRQGYWGELPFPTAGGLTNPGIEPMSLVSPALAGGFFATAPPGKPHRFSILLGIYPGVGSLGHMVTLCLIKVTLCLIQGSTRLFSNWLHRFYNPSNRVWGFRWLHILASTCYCLSFGTERCRGSRPMLSLTQSETSES